MVGLTFRDEDVEDGQAKAVQICFDQTLQNWLFKVRGNLVVNLRSAIVLSQSEPSYLKVVHREETAIQQKVVVSGTYDAFCAHISVSNATFLITFQTLRISHTSKTLKI